MPRTLLPVVLLFALFATGTTPASARRGDPALTGREAKILFKVERLRDLGAGLQKIWNEVKKVAEKQGLEVVDDPTFLSGKRFRNIAFYDTAKFGLYKAGYIIRRRQDDEIRPPRDGHKHEGKTDLTFKFRNPELQLEMLSIVKPAEGYPSDTKVEEDIVAGPDSIKRMYSISTKVKVPVKHLDGDVKAFARFFPGILELGLDAATPVPIVNGVLIDECSYTAGKIVLSPTATAKAEFAVWTRHNDEKPLIIEFSYKYDVSTTDAQHTAFYRNGAVADKLLKGIQEALRSSIAVGQTKTGLVYGATSANHD